MIAADRDTLVQNVLDAVKAGSHAKPLGKLPQFRKVIDTSAKAIQQKKDDSAEVCWEWFARPFDLARILREVFEYDRGDQLDVVELLERQGFNVIEALGGVGAIAGERYDILHRGMILAPGKFTKAARMLDLFNAPQDEPEGWVPAEAGTLTRVNWRLEKAFWASETLINDAVDDNIFRDMIDGIKNDPEGPQIDIGNNFLPHLDDQLILITDNTQPAGPDSDRMLVAIRVKNAAAVQRVVKKAMDVEPDAIKLKVPGFDIWKVQQSADDDDLDADLELSRVWIWRRN